MYLNLAREMENMEHESDGDTNCNWFASYSHSGIGTKTGRLRNKRMSGIDPN